MKNTFLVATVIASALPKGSCHEANKWLHRIQSGDKMNQRKQANLFFKLHKPDENVINEIITFVEQ